MPLDLQAILPEIVAITRESGALLRENVTQPLRQTTKTSSVDIVTEVDEAAEALITAALGQRFPDHHLVGEEGGGSGAPADQAQYFWYIDPIDGTTNFASRIPHFCTSIALTDADRQPLLGVIYDPMRDELYSAIQGKGATLNGDPLAVTATDDLAQAVVASGFPYDKRTNPDNNAANWAAFLVRTRGVRRFGSAALDLAYVAAGRYDGYWERSLNPWDALAGMLLVREAGGRVTDYTGGDHPQMAEDGRYLASNGHLHDAMLAVLDDTLKTAHR